MPFSVNVTTIPRTYNGVRVLPGIHPISGADDQKMRADPSGRLSQQWEKVIYVFESLEAVEGSFDQDNVRNLVDLSFKQHVGHVVRRDELLRLYWRGFTAAPIKDYLNYKKQVFEGRIDDGKSKFQGTGETYNIPV